jgi:hypothetical protein
MKYSHILLVAAAAAFGLLLARTAPAADEPLKFLHALQEEGYPDIAVDYLKTIKDQADAPPEIMEVWDLEMARSLRSAARTAYDEKQAKELTDQAQKFLQKFIAEKPDHPEAVREDAKWADLLGQDALKELRRGKELADEKQKAEALDKARKLFEEVRPRFQKAQDKFKAKLAKMPKIVQKPKLTPKEKKQLEARLDAEYDLNETELKIAITDFYLAQTFANVEDPKRKDALTAAGKVFDKIFQDNRDNIWGVHAHFMHARTMHELGDLELAMEIYDEVMVGAPDIGAEQPTRGKGSKIALTGEERLYSEIEQYRLQILLDARYKKRNVKEYYREAQQWIAPAYHPYYLQTEGYQGILFDYAKFNLALAKKEETSEANKKIYTAEAVKALKLMRKVGSEYQQEAVRMLREQGINPGDAGLDELFTEADEAAKAKQWQQALEKYEKALNLVQNPGKPAGKVDANKVLLVRSAIAGCHCNIALGHFRNGKLAEAKQVLRQVLKDYRDTENGPAAAELLLTVTTNEYATAAQNAETAKAEHEQAKAGKDEAAVQAAKEKLDAAEKNRDEAKQALVKLADGIIKIWPGKPVADTARLAKGRMELYGGNIAKAMEPFGEINPNSPSYSTALYLAGLTYWRQYLQAKGQMERKKTGNVALEPDEEKSLGELRKRAVGAMDLAVQAVKRMPPSPTGRLSRQGADAYLLLAEMKLEGGEAKEAAVLFQPLLDEMQKPSEDGSQQQLDPTALRVLNGAVKAFLQTNEIDKASKAANVLLKLGKDSTQVNIVLVDFAKKLDQERRTIEQARDAEQGDTRTKLSEKLAGCEKMLCELLKNLAKREKMSVAGTNWVGDTCIAVNLTDEAKDVFNALIERIEDDPEFAKAKLAIRVKLISIYRKKGELDNALEQVEQLAKDAPKALPPMLEKGHILQALAETSTEAEKHEAAVAHWDWVRRRLENVKTGKDKKQRMPEYYQVIAFEGQCFLNFAKKISDKAQAKRGEQILRQALMFDSNMPPDHRNRLLDIADKLCIQQGNTPPKREKPAVPGKRSATGKKSGS